MKAPEVQEFLSSFTQWAQGRPDILAAALVGSYARNAAREDSDVDLVVIASRPEHYLADLSWTSAFGRVERHQMEDYGLLVSVRVWYTGGLEVEFGITGREWAASPLDEGTRQVISDGMVVLFGQEDMLSKYASVSKTGKRETHRN